MIYGGNYEHVSNFFETKSNCCLAINISYFFHFHLIARKLFRRLYYGLKALRIKMTWLIIDQLLMWELLKDLYYGLKVLRMKMT